MPVAKPLIPSNRDDPLFLLRCHRPYSSSLNPSAGSGTGTGTGVPGASRFTRPSGSSQNVGNLGGGEYDSKLIENGCARSDFGQNPIIGGVELHDRHVFLCYKSPPVWPPRIEAAEFDRLPRLLAATLFVRKRDMKRETHLTVCEGHDGAETSNGDVLIFPDMIKYRSLTHFDVDAFVEDVLVNDGEWFPGNPEALKGWYIFVCCHGSRDPQCGICGPSVIRSFKKEIELRGLQGKVSVRPCSHIEGHKYAGNVLVFGPDTKKEVTGHWYGYVLPEDVPLLIDQHFGEGEIVDYLGSVQMGLSEEDQHKSQELTNTIDSGTVCASQVLQSNHGEVDGRWNIYSIPTWYQNWECEDTYAVLAVVVAIVSVVLVCRANR